MQELHTSSPSAARPTKTAKARIDMMLVDQGLAESRSRAQALIMAGHVMVGDQVITKPGQTVPADADIRVKGRDHPWVSRGGIKLDHALTAFGWSVDDATAIDVGSSTGGFTDVMLQRGARRVYAVDSGTNQLAWSLRQDARVVVHEQLSARLLTAAHIPEPVDLIVCDASFISLAKVLAVPMQFAAPNARMVALIKPQFEAARHEIGKNGVVRDGDVHARICADVAAWITAQGWVSLPIIQSPITGPKGNVEFLIGAARDPARLSPDAEPFAAPSV